MAVNSLSLPCILQSVTSMRRSSSGQSSCPCSAWAFFHTSPLLGWLVTVQMSVLVTTPTGPTEAGTRLTTSCLIVTKYHTSHKSHKPYQPKVTDIISALLDCRYATEPWAQSVALSLCTLYVCTHTACTGRNNQIWFGII